MESECKSFHAYDHMEPSPVSGYFVKVGDFVEKTKGYPFRGTVLAIGQKSDGKYLCMVEIEPGPNAAGLVYIHPPEVLRPIEEES